MERFKGETWDRVRTADVGARKGFVSIPPSLRAKRKQIQELHKKSPGLLRRGACHRAAAHFARPGVAPRNDG